METERDPGRRARILVVDDDPMVARTGGAFTDDAQRFLDTVPNLKVWKPFTPKDLRDVVRDMLDR